LDCSPFDVVDKYQTKKMSPAMKEPTDPYKDPSRNVSKEMEGMKNVSAPPLTTLTYFADA